MLDLACWAALADPDISTDERIRWLLAVAQLPARDRWPFYMRIAAWTQDPHPKVRCAAVQALSEAAGYPARVRLLGALDDGEPDVREAALGAWAAISHQDPPLWIHALYHPRADVRLGAQHLGPPPSLPTRAWLPLLADPAVADGVRDRLNAHGVAIDGIGALLALAGRGIVAADWALERIADRRWSADLSMLLQAGADEPARLQPLLRLAVAPPPGAEPTAEAMLAAWLQVIARGQLPDTLDQILGEQLEAAIAATGPPIAAALALLYAISPEALAQPEHPLDQRWAALRRLADHRPQAPVTPRPALLAEDFAPPVHDLLANAGLVRIAGSGALQALVMRADVDALCEAIVGTPAHGVALLGVPMTHRRDRSARRHLVARSLQRHGARAARLLAHLGLAVPGHDLALLHVRPAQWTTDQETELLTALFEALAERDAAVHVPERRSRQLAKTWAHPDGAALRILLSVELVGPLVRDILSEAVRAASDDRIRALPAAALHRLLEIEEELPFAVAQNLAGVLAHHGDATIRGWATRTSRAPRSEPAPAPVARSPSARRLSPDDLHTIAGASAAHLPEVLSERVRGPVSGLLAALDARTPRPDVRVCVAVLQSTEPLHEIAATLRDWSSEDEGFLRALDRAVVGRFAHQAQVSSATGAWLWRWDGPFAVFQQHLRALGIEPTLTESLELPWAPLRARIWQATRHQVGRWRWRDPEVATARLSAGVLRACASVLLPRRAGAATRAPGAYAAHATDHTAVSLAAARILLAAHYLGLDTKPLRDPAERALSEVPRAVAMALAPWLGNQPEAASAAPAEGPPAPAPPVDLEVLEDVAAIRPWLRDPTPSTVELAALRLLELGERGARVILDELTDPACAHPDLVSRAVAAFSDGPTLDAARAAATDRGYAPRVRFFVGLALAEAHDGSPEPALQALLDPGPAGWLRSAPFDRLVDQLPRAEHRTVARLLVDSDQFPAFRWAVRLLAEEPGRIDLDALGRFLGHGTERPVALRVAAAEALRDGGSDVGAPILAAHQGERLRSAHPEAALSVHPLALPEIVKAALWAGPSRLPLRRVAEALSDSALAPEVRGQAASALLRHADDLPVQTLALKHLTDTRTVRSRQARRLGEVFLWGRDQAKALLGRSFEIKLIGGEALGWTRLEQRAIHVNPVPMFRGERHGSALLKGLIIHELGHHVYNGDREGRAIWRTAVQEGLGRLHNLVCDEHLERNLRSRNPEYDEVLKQLAAWAFLHNQTDVPALELVDRLGPHAVALTDVALSAARRSGHVQIRMGQLFRELEAGGSSFGRFVRALRMGLGNRWGDPKVGEGLALFGRSFRGLDNAGLWHVTQEVRRIFGDEVELLHLVDLHDTCAGGESDGVIHGRGLQDAEVQRETDRLERDRARDTSDGRSPASGWLNDSGEDAFDRIDHVVTLVHDPEAHAPLAREVARYARHMREALTALGLAHRTIKPRLRGHRIDRGRLVPAVLRGDPRFLATREVVRDTDLFVGICVDCSGSMGGSRMERARLFATLLAEACRGLPGVDLRLFGFTDATIFDAGTAHRCAAHALEANGGNNDAAGLFHAASAARRSRRKAKLLVMISDGLPTECSVTALRSLVRDLSRRQRMACAQVAVASVSTPCFDTYIEVLDDEPGTAVREFGTIVQRLVADTLKGAA